MFAPGYRYPKPALWPVEDDVNFVNFQPYKNQDYLNRREIIGFSIIL
ncbi:hypothetical protein A4U88_5131 [Serratia marcescens]|nr:hypothetical protein A4U88_5131 [Serratia marcescens]